MSQLMIRLNNHSLMELLKLPINSTISLTRDRWKFTFTAPHHAQEHHQLWLHTFAFMLEPTTIKSNGKIHMMLLILLKDSILKASQIWELFKELLTAIDLYKIRFCLMLRLREKDLKELLTKRLKRWEESIWRSLRLREWESLESMTKKRNLSMINSIDLIEMKRREEEIDNQSSKKFQFTITMSILPTVKRIMAL